MQHRFGVLDPLPRGAAVRTHGPRHGRDPEPRRPHEKLGEVYLEPSGNPAVAEMEQAIRTEAAKLGADAAVLVYDRTKRIGTVYQGPWWARSSYAVYGRRIVAVAIHYRR